MSERIDHDHHEAQRHGIERSHHWPAVRAKHLELQPFCAACWHEHSGPVQVHHIFPFHYAIALGRPDLELDLRNLVTLCEEEKGTPAANHHLLLGHLGNFKFANLNVQKDARYAFHGDTEEQIRSDPRWQERHVYRLVPLDEMTAVDRQWLKAEMDRIFPVREPNYGKAA